MDDAGNDGAIRVGWTVAVLALVATWAYALYFYPGLPDRIPSHFDMLGRPTGWGSKWLLLFLPGTGTFALALAFALRNVPPNLPFAVRPERLARVVSISQAMTAALMAILMLGFFGLEVSMVRGAASSALPPAFLGVTAAMVVAAFSCVSVGIYRMYRAA